MKTYLFIDGTNLYASQFELFGPQKYLIFPRFIKELENKIKVKFSQIYFYASYSPKPKRLNKKQSLYLKNEGLFYKGVRETKDVFFLPAMLIFSRPCLQSRSFIAKREFICFVWKIN